MVPRTAPDPLDRVHLLPGCHAPIVAKVVEALKWSAGRCGSVLPLTWSRSCRCSCRSRDRTITYLARATRAKCRRSSLEVPAPPPPARAKLHHRLASRHTIDRQLRPRNPTTVDSASAGMTLGVLYDPSQFPRPHVRTATIVYLQKSAVEHLIADSLLRSSSSPIDTTPRSPPT
jgi:hypothetical protein